MARQPKPTAPPLAATIRQALASDWRTLAALDTLTAARGSDARRLVHEALRALRGEGCVLEERVGKAGVEVRLAPATLPAPRPDDGSGWGTPALDEPLSPAERERAETLLMADECTAAEIEELRGYEAREESSRGARLRREAEAVKASQEAAPPQPGPSSRCAVCEVTYARHEEARRRGGGELHTFTPRPRGRPPAPERAPVAPIPNAAPAILPRVRQCRTPGPVVDVDGGRVERAPFPPCVDCGEEPGTCPEGRCRDCDIEHLMTAGSCRECLTWIMREDMAGPREKQHSIGCSLAAEPCYPRNAAEYIATRKMRYGWTPPQGWKLTGCAAGAAAEPETSMGRGDAPVLPPAQQRTARRAEANEREAAALAQIKGPPPCRPPLCYRDDIHEPARVRGFARPLCERHRAWVEGAGGTVASEADVAALHAT